MDLRDAFHLELHLHLCLFHFPKWGAVANTTSTPHSALDMSAEMTSRRQERASANPKKLSLFLPFRWVRSARLLHEEPSGLRHPHGRQLLVARGAPLLRDLVPLLVQGPPQLQQTVAALLDLWQKGDVHVRQTGGFLGCLAAFHSGTEFEDEHQSETERVGQAVAGLLNL
jgi:hypothetical protein